MRSSRTIVPVGGATANVTSPPLLAPAPDTVNPAVCFTPSKNTDRSAVSNTRKLYAKTVVELLPV